MPLNNRSTLEGFLVNSRESNCTHTSWNTYFYFISDTECESDSCPYEHTCTVSDDNDIECDCDRIEGIDDDCEGGTHNKLHQMMLNLFKHLNTIIQIYI